jgi:alkylation response protein AidB-like acyl-CoA dehydrogenase
MIPFELTEEQKALREKARIFAENEIAPIAIDMDEKREFPRDVFYKMGKMGFAGMLIPEEYGGSGMNYVSFSLVFQELNRASVGISVCLVPHIGHALMIYKFGTEQQRRRFIPPLARGEKLGAFAMTEPEAGSDASAIKTTAILKGDKYILNGTKSFTTNAEEAEQYLVIARTDPNAKGSKGLSALIVPKGLPGFTFGKRENKMGSRANPTGTEIFEDCPVPKENLLGEEGQGLRIGLTLIDYARITAAAGAVGVARAALEAAIKFAKERVQFGRPIAQFQGIQFMLAEMATQLEVAECMLYGVCNLIDMGKTNTQYISMVKVFASDMAMKVTTDAVQILGGYGYMKEYRVEGYMRDAKLLQIYDGTNEIQKVIIARDMLGSGTF